MHIIESTGDISFLEVNIDEILSFITLYGTSVKPPTSRKLQEYRNGSLRIVFNTHSVEYSNVLNRANLPRLQNRRLQDLATLMYKVIYGLYMVWYLVTSLTFSV